MEVWSSKFSGTLAQTQKLTYSVLGHMLDIPWTYVEHTLDMSWTYPDKTAGHRDMCSKTKPTYRVHVLGLMWDSGTYPAHTTLTR